MKTNKELELIATPSMNNTRILTEAHEYEYQTGKSMSLWKQILLGAGESWCDDNNHLKIIEGAIGCNIKKSERVPDILVQCSKSVFKKIQSEIGPPFGAAEFISTRFDNVTYNNLAFRANFVEREDIPDGYLVVPSINGSTNYYKIGDSAYWLKDPINTLHIKFIPCK